MSWQLFAFGSAFFAALTAIFGKVGVSDLNSNLATFIRTVVVLIASAIIISMRNEWVKPESLPTKSLMFLIFSGLATGASWLCYYRALQMAPASRVAPIDKLSVVLVLIFAFAFLGESFTWKTALGGLLIASGTVILAL